ncbi:MAG: hypothetical protein ABSG89_06020 [Bacteroidales bacterium]|jgi:hypothetical protein
MKRFLIRAVVLTVILMSVTLNASAPSGGMLPVISPVSLNPYKRLIYAVGYVETKCDTLAFNPIEEAAGYFQIRPVRLEDYNRRTGSHLEMIDMFNYKTSERIFLYYADLVGPYDFEKIARTWNGSGSSTIYYWNRIKKYL